MRSEPKAAALRLVLDFECVVQGNWCRTGWKDDSAAGQHLPSTTILRVSCHLDLDTVDAVHTVKKEYQDEDECDLSIVSRVSC